MSAVISPCGKYRYVLTRNVPSTVVGWVRPVLFVMLNPSTADAEVDDPTIRKCVGFAKLHGYTQLTVVNLFAFRATDPKELWKVVDPIGPDNDSHIAEQIGKHRTGEIVVAWGAHKQAKVRGEWFIQKTRADHKVVCLGKTKGGFPRHPLYIRYDAPLTFFEDGV